MYVNTTKPHPSPVAVRLRVTKTAGFPTIPKRSQRLTRGGFSRAGRNALLAEQRDGSQDDYQDKRCPPAEVVTDQGAQRYPERECNRQPARGDSERSPPLLRWGPEPWQRPPTCG
jgi:hypothetical protein